MKIKTHYTKLIFFIFLIQLLSCIEHYEGKYFSFPPGSKPHEKNWQYFGNIRITSDELPFTVKCNKYVNITITDINKEEYLDEDFEYNCASIEANITWNQFENIIIELNEVGNEFSKDNYNKQLIKFGPNHLATLRYRYDVNNKIFKRIE